MTGGHLKELRALEAGGGDINLLVRVCELHRQRPVQDRRAVTQRFLH
jgi:hypothetical protein